MGLGQEFLCLLEKAKKKEYFAKYIYIQEKAEQQPPLGTIPFFRAVNFEICCLSINIYPIQPTTTTHLTFLITFFVSHSNITFPIFSTLYEQTYAHLPSLRIYSLHFIEPDKHSLFFLPSEHLKNTIEAKLREWQEN
jgi:hypothetical protein